LFYLVGSGPGGSYGHLITLLHFKFFVRVFIS